MRVPKQQYWSTLIHRHAEVWLDIGNDWQVRARINDINGRGPRITLYSIDRLSTLEIIKDGWTLWGYVRPRGPGWDEIEFEDDSSNPHNNERNEAMAMDKDKLLRAIADANGGTVTTDQIDVVEAFGAVVFADIDFEAWFFKKHVNDPDLIAAAKKCLARLEEKTPKQKG